MPPLTSPSFSLAVYEHGELVWREHHLDELELGRQLVPLDEPGRYALSEGLDAMRLVIADNSERTISRHHIYLQIAEHSITVVNRSGVRPILCDGQVLMPGAELDLSSTSVARLELPDRMILVGPCDGVATAAEGTT